MAICRVYLFTYNRNYLLPRAVNSLLAQTITDWVCEVHNDCPEDNFPENYIASLKDKRFKVINHNVNLGPTASFNLAFGGCAEKFASILEDDNWWEPEFLAEMTNLMDTNPGVSVAWCNMKIWKEMPERQWEQIGVIASVSEGQDLIDWPNTYQAMGALHSNGAMIYEGSKAINYLIPDNTLFDSVELVRERAFVHPICRLNKPLANFAVTIQSSRSTNNYAWTATQSILLASFLRANPQKAKITQETLAFYRYNRPSPTPAFFIAFLWVLKDFSLVKYFRAKDWCVCFIWLIKNIFVLKKIKNYIVEHHNVYLFLLTRTTERFEDS